MDVDTRLLRYFVAVAEEGHLTRAAHRLFVSQPAVTKAIRQLENLLGVQLFVRSRSGMALTQAGRTLADDVPALLSDLDRVLRETKGSAGQAARVLTVGFVASAANEATQGIIAAFMRRRPGWRVDMRQTGWTDPSAGLADGTVDAALVRLPFPGQENFHVKVLFAEPRWVALPETHSLATRDSIAMQDLLDEQFVAPPEPSGWRDYWMGADERHDHPGRIGAIATNPEEWLTAIANGYGISLAPASAARYYHRPGVTYRPVTGVGPSQVGVAWTDPIPAVEDFIRCCQESQSPSSAQR
jgi:DNA-binding transcriptional LysR family regulator